MSIRLPAYIYYGIKDAIYQATTASTEQAGYLADTIVGAINWGISEVLALSKDYSVAVSDSLRSDVTNSLNLLGGEIADVEWRVREDTAQVLSQVITDLASIDSGIQEETAQAIIQSNEAIAESHHIVGDHLVTTHKSIQEQFERTVDTAIQGYTAAKELTLLSIEEVSTHINAGFDTLIKDTLQLILPAEAAEAVMTWKKILTSPAAFDFLEAGGDAIFTRLDKFVTIDLDEMKQWIDKVHYATIDRTWEAMQKEKAGE